MLTGTISATASIPGEDKMSVKVALFGTSRSGKDYTIHDATIELARKGMDFEHISPIKMVRTELKSRKLSNIPDNEKESIIRKVRRAIRTSDSDYVFVDEHYCFPETYGGVRIDNGYYGEKLPYHNEIGYDDRVYEVVYGRSWISKYDMAVYMEIDPEVIVDRFRTSDGPKKNLFVTTEDVRLWQIFEIEQLQKLCRRFRVPLFYVYNHRDSGKELATIISFYLKNYKATESTSTKINTVMEE